MGMTRLAARTLVFALGLELMAILIVSPLGRAPLGEYRTLQIELGAFALLLLTAGTIRASALLLLFAAPAAIAMPLAIQPATAGAPLAEPILLAATCAGLASYLLAAAWLVRTATPATAAPLRSLQPATRTLSRSTYGFFLAAALLVPLALGCVLIFTTSESQALRLAYPGKAQAMRALLLLGLIALGPGIAGAHLLRPLLLFGEGDAELRAGPLQASVTIARPRRRALLQAIGLAALAIAGVTLWLLRRA